MKSTYKNNSERPFIDTYLDSSKKNMVEVPYYKQPNLIEPKQPFIFEIKKTKDKDKIIKYKSMDDF